MEECSDFNHNCQLQWSLGSCWFHSVLDLQSFLDLAIVLENWLIFAADTRGHEAGVDLHAAEGHTPAPAQDHVAGSETALTPATVADPGTGPGPGPGLEIAVAAVLETGPDLDPVEETMIRSAHVHQRTEGE